METDAPNVRLSALLVMSIVTTATKISVVAVIYVKTVVKVAVGVPNVITVVNV